MDELKTLFRRRQANYVLCGPRADDELDYNIPVTDDAMPRDTRYIIASRHDKINGRHRAYQRTIDWSPSRSGAMGLGFFFTHLLVFLASAVRLWVKTPTSEHGTEDLSLPGGSTYRLIETRVAGRHGAPPDGDGPTIATSLSNEKRAKPGPRARLRRVQLCVYLALPWRDRLNRRELATRRQGK